MMMTWQKNASNIAGALTITLMSFGMCAPGATAAPVAAARPAAAGSPADPSTSEAPEAPPAKVDKDAANLISQMNQAYANLKRFSATITMEMGTAEKPIHLRTALVMERPNHLSALSTDGVSVAQVICDGNFLYAFSSLDKSRYLKIPAPTTVAGAMGKTDVEASFGLMPFLLLGAPLAPMSVGVTDVTVGPPGSVDGTPVDKVLVDSKPAPGLTGRITFSIGKDDHLLRSMVFTSTSADGQKETVTETHSDLQIDPPIKDEVFQFQAPDGATAVSSLVPPKYDPSIVPGSKLSDFATTDMDGKPENLGRYKGKVLLLYFWKATRPSCQVEIPQLVSLYKKLQPDGLEILGVDLDDDSSRTGLTNFMAKQGITWPQLFGEKAENVVSLYQLTVLPFTIVLDRSGKVAAVDVYDADLEHALRTTLVKPTSGG